MTEARSATAVIVGGTDGLGRTLAIRYLRAGWRVIVLGRTDRRTMADAAASYVPVDLTDAASVHGIAPSLSAAGVDAIDVLIHCAGIGWVGDTALQSAASIDAMVAVNIWTPVAITHQLLPLVERVQGRIVLIGSIAAFVPAPHYAVYAASKMAIDGFVRSFAQEIGARVTVQVIHPGAIGTAFHAKAGATSLDPARFPAPDVVADRVMRAMKRRRWRVFPDALTAILAGVAGPAKGLIDAIVAWRTHSVSRNQVKPFNPDDVPVALVTGAGSGLGAALTVQLINAGYRVIGVDRLPLASMAADRLARYEPLTADLTDQDGIALIAAQVGREAPLTLLVHCAGTSAVGPFASGALAVMRPVLHTNLTGPMQLTARLLRGGSA